MIGGSPLVANLRLATPPREAPLRLRPPRHPASLFHTSRPQITPAHGRSGHARFSETMWLTPELKARERASKKGRQLGSAGRPGMNAAPNTAFGAQGP